MADTEEALVESFVSLLSSDATPWGPVRIAREFYYVRGRADVVALDASGEVIAIEAKLHRWRDALQQAYRNRCFAHASYVLLPKDIALRAAGHQADFLARGVGVCYIEGNQVSIVLAATRMEPLQPWLSKTVQGKVLGDLGA